MAAKVTNNAYGTLSAGITNTATTLTLNSGEGARFPALGAGDYFYATLVDTSNNLEIIKVTARSVDSMTIVRGQDGTTARAYALNDRLELRPVAALFNEKVDLETITPVSRGGTGQSTLTANAVLIGNGTSGVNAVAPGAAGNVLTSNGSSWASQSLSVVGRLIGFQVFTASGTYTKATNNPNFVVVEVVGGGGTGGSSAAVANGGTSSFGTHCSATGGTSGNKNVGGAGGTGSGGNINLTGGGGSIGEATANGAGGAGGNSVFGGGARCGATSSRYAGAANTGGGGQGGSYSSGKQSYGAAGGGAGGYAIEKILASSLASSVTVTVGAGGSGGTSSGSGGSGVVIVWEYA